MFNRRNDLSLQPDRTIGWIIALSGALLLLGRLPTILEQRGSFAEWWMLIGAVLLLLIVALAVLGRWLPGAVLKGCWAAVPLIGIVVSATWALAYVGEPLSPDSSFDPWNRGMEAGIIVYPLLLVRLRAAISFGLLFPVVSLLSPLVFWGNAPRFLIADIPIHIGMVAFVVIFAGIRARLQRVFEDEKIASLQLEREFLAEQRRARQGELGRLVHDEVLSALAAAMQTSGTPSEELKREAGAALRAMDDAERFGRLPERMSSRQGIEVLVDSMREFEVAEVRVVSPTHEPLDAPGSVINALSMAAREAVRNSMKYAGSGPVVVEVSPRDAGWSVTVSDVGPGFDLETVPRDRLGVRESLIGRMRAVGGDATIVSRMGAGSGTRVELSWPR